MSASDVAGGGSDSADDDSEYGEEDIGSVQGLEQFASEEESEREDEIGEGEDVVGMEGVAVTRESKALYHKAAALVTASRHTSKFKREDPNEAVAQKAPSQSSRDAGIAAARLYRRTNCVPAETNIADGFYDAGRNTGALESLASLYGHANFGREVILVNALADPSLDALVREAELEVKQAHVPYSQIPATLKDDTDQPLPGVHEVLLERERVACLARFVSGRLGGVAAPGGESISALTRARLAEIKAEQGSNVLPLGEISPYGTCRHRAILFKVLGERIRPAVRSTLVRGSKGSDLHAWSSILRLTRFPTTRLSRSRAERPSAPFLRTLTRLCLWTLGSLSKPGSALTPHAAGAGTWCRCGSRTLCWSCLRGLASSCAKAPTRPGHRDTHHDLSQRVILWRSVMTSMMVMNLKMVMPAVAVHDQCGGHGIIDKNP